MSDRQVTASRKDYDGDIAAICNAEEDWSPRLKSDAISDIESGKHTYYVMLGSDRINIEVVDGKYLRTDLDKTTENNLDDLPDC